MREQIFGVLDVVLAGGGSDVAICVPVAFHLAVVTTDGHVVADVELPPLVQQRSLDVFLDDEGAVSSI